jgi:asparaginyl-tRNA synthetase
MSFVTHRVAALLAGRVPVGSSVRVQGWIRTRRDSKSGVSFLAVHDGSGFQPVQVVVDQSLPNYTSEVLKLTAGAAVECDGELVQSQGKGQAVELVARAVRVLGLVDDPETYPIQPKAHSPEFLREVAHLRPRTNLIGAVTRVRHTLAQAVHRFFHEDGFFWIHTPIITASRRSISPTCRARRRARSTSSRTSSAARPT